MVVRAAPTSTDASVDLPLPLVPQSSTITQRLFSFSLNVVQGCQRRASRGAIRGAGDGSWRV